MNNDRIECRNGKVVAYIGNDATRLFAAMTLRSALRMLKAGIQPTRGYTMKKALAATELYTRYSYRRNEADRAIEDLSEWINAMQAALPVVQED